MIEISDVVFHVNRMRLGHLKVKYYDLTIKCDLCLYKNQKLWVRMPEIWIGNHKHNFIYWESKEKSRESQDIILNKVFDLTGFTLEKAIKLKNEWTAIKKKADKNKQNI